MRLLTNISRMAPAAVSAVLLVAALTTTARSQETPDVPLSQYGNWTYGCPGGECGMEQKLGNPEQPGIRYGMAISKSKGKPNPLVRLTFPLGIYLPAGIGVKISDLKLDIPVAVCLPTGCNALFAIDDEIKRAMIGAGEIKVRFYVTDSNSREITYSMDGFVQSFSEIDK